MEEASVYEQARAIADEVLRGIPHVGVDVDRWGHASVSLDLLNEDSGECLSRIIATTRGDVVRPELVAKEGLTAKVEELARRLKALDVRARPYALEAWDAPVTAIARSVMAGSGEDTVSQLDDEGHWMHCRTCWSG
ncbi:hypothetical protein [Corallococcus carmarthensis]|uniref:Uncharacterized protein n=1 Tax=Corallococcus carmarthensis TaxID=2316728 RepID=A0A3A8KGA9_9BACT|nr:hypothetical protein [Corallococcus carmarthensis]NOK16466.1 hypothetical protein [Corallococcus carmarthensis]RKH07228.1 hypothetical protein D7X32_02445 [Corallococcus carmarthensis]